MTSLAAEAAFAERGPFIGRYRIVDKLGQGAMGEVFRAHDAILDRFVAIKTMAGDMLESEEHAARFTREAQSAARLNHANVVTLLEFGKDAHQFFIAMEYVEGADLADTLSAGRLTSLSQKLAVLEQVLDGVAHAHAAGIIHRDLKPANIHVRPDGHVKVMDFGLARSSGSDVTRDGAVFGTPSYMAPEQIRGQQVTPASDVFALGALAYEVLSGRRAFDAPSMHEVFHEVIDSDPPPLAPELGVPTVVAAFVAKALAKDAELRYPNASAMRSAFEICRRTIEGQITNDDALSRIQRGVHAPADTSRTRRRRDSRAQVEATLDLTPQAAVVRHDSPSKRDGQPLRVRAGWVAAASAVLLGSIALTGVARLGREDDRSIKASLDALTRSLVETRVAVAESRLDDQDFFGAAQSAESALRLDSTNAHAADIHDRAISALQAIEFSVAEARRAITAGDLQAASKALEDVMSKDPNNAVVAELSAQVNEHFEDRASLARSSMENARRAALQIAGPKAPAAFADGARLSAAAEKEFTDRNFARAAQSFMAARRAYARAMRSSAAFGDHAPRKDASPAIAMQMNVAASGASDGIEQRPLELSVGPSSPAGNWNSEAGLDLEVLPSPLRLDWPFRVRAFVRNGRSEEDLRVEGLIVTVIRNGAITVPHVQLQQKSIKAGRRDLIASIPGAWLAGTYSWEFTAEAQLKNGTILRRHIRLKPATTS